MKSKQPRQLSQRIRPEGRYTHTSHSLIAVVYRINRGFREASEREAGTTLSSSDSVDIGDQRNDEFRVSDSHRQTSLVGRRRTDVSNVVAAWSWCAVDSGVRFLVVSSWYGEAS